MISINIAEGGKNHWGNDEKQKSTNKGIELSSADLWTYRMTTYKKRNIIIIIMIEIAIHEDE